MCDCTATPEEQQAGIHEDGCAIRTEGPPDQPSDHYRQ
jgi:hypothetical protein